MSGSSVAIVIKPRTKKQKHGKRKEGKLLTSFPVQLVDGIPGLIGRINHVDILVGFRDRDHNDAVDGEVHGLGVR